MREVGEVDREITGKTGRMMKGREEKRERERESA
jgi:hypothetical protein